MSPATCPRGRDPVGRLAQFRGVGDQVDGGGAAVVRGADSADKGRSSCVHSLSTRGLTKLLPIPLEGATGCDKNHADCVLSMSSN